MIERKQIFVNGKWVDSSGDGVLTVINPATEEPVATVPRGSVDDVDRAARAAADAFAAWSQTSVEERTAAVSELARLTEARSDDIARAIITEVGQPGRLGHEQPHGQRRQRPQDHRRHPR
jgi:aldehyde dehydrogenase (NAD+)